jgi:transposase
MTHPGLGRVTTLATDVFVGDPSRFPSGKTLAGYVGLSPSEYSSGARQRLGHLTKQGNPFVAWSVCRAS